jgi:hypothetical protein
MNTRLLMFVAALAVAAGPAVAQESVKAKATAVPASTKAAAKPAAKAQAMDPQAMAEMMEKMAAPGPQHERLQKLAGQWIATVRWTWDPSQAMQETKSTSVITTLMDGRYSQEVNAGEMQGRPFQGMGLTGYDNILKKYVSVWFDNMGTGFMTSQGTPDATGSVVNWTSEFTDAMTGKTKKCRLVTRFQDDDHRVFEMFDKGPDGKEFKAMEITYERSKS